MPPHSFCMTIHKKALFIFHYLPATCNLNLFSSGLLPKSCVSIIISIFFLSSPLYAQLRASPFPKFVDLSQVQGAVVARICLNQILAVPPEQQSRISSSTQGELLRCMINYREVFSNEQLEIIRHLIVNTHLKAQ